MRDASPHAPAGGSAPHPRRLPVIWILLAAASPLLLLGAWLAPWTWLPALIGRGHPLVLHFPIALLILVALLEAVEAGSRGRIAAPQGLILFIGTFTAILAAVSGYLLMRSEVVEGARVERHLVGGVVVASLAWLTLAVRLTLSRELRPARRWGYRGLLGALCVALGVAGHDGASLTHGEDYLTEHLPWRATESVVRLQLPVDKPAREWDAYAHVVAPILEVRCYSCHNRAIQIKL